MSGIVVGKLYMNTCIHCDALVEPWNQMKKKIGKMVKVIDDIESRDLDTKLKNGKFKRIEHGCGFRQLFKRKRRQHIRKKFQTLSEIRANNGSAKLSAALLVV